MQQWFLVDPGRWLFREWPDEEQAIVYDQVGGDTHLIETAGMEVCRLLMVSQLSSADISTALAEFFEEPDPQVVVEYITTTLQQLQNAGLVASTPL